MSKLTRLLALLWLALLGAAAQAQVTVSPANFKAEDEITITYDATQGTSGLRGVNKVYMHAGVILDGENSTNWTNVVGNWGQDDGVGLMTSLGNDRWSIKLVPRTYFRVPAQRIFRLGMVFRNADGTREGKSTQNGDIFVQVSFEGLAMSITAPSPRPFSAFPNEELEVRAETTQPATITIWVNNQQVRQETGSNISHRFNVGTSSGTVRLQARTDQRTVVDSFRYDILPRQTVAALPPNMQDGINYLDERTAVLVLFAPQKRFAYAIGDFNNWQADQRSFMNITPDRNRFWIRLENLEPRREYVYQYLIDGNTRIGDPYAEKVLDPNNDRFIEPQVYPNPTPYPTGRTTDLTTVLQTGQTPYQWRVNNFRRPAPQDLVIYELLVRDFSAAHSYQAVLDSLDYLKRLGVNALKIMPVQEFEGNDSWGYNPIYYFAPDKYYGTKDMLKNFIDKAHEQGFAVILDLVLNHNFGQSPLVRLYWDSQTNKPAAGNPYFNPDATHPFNVGFDFNHESAATKALVKRVNEFWLKEYKVDGYRFDLSKGFTQVNSGSDVGRWSAYDASRVALWKQIYDDIRAVDASAYVILEHFAENREEVELSNYGMMFWGNMNDAYSRAAQGTGNSLNGVSHLQRNWQRPFLISYMESHDEERLMVRTLQNGLAADGYNIRNPSTALERMKQAAAFYFTVPGPKMIWQFGELGYDISINQNGRTGRKPILWEYAQNPERLRLYKTYAALARLKSLPNAAEALRSNNFLLTERNSGLEKIINLQSPALDMVVVGNFGLQAAEVRIDFPGTGTWFDYFTGESLEVLRTDATMPLARGQFHVLSSKPLPTPERGLVPWALPTRIVATQDPEFAARVLLYPNPAQGQALLQVSGQGGAAQATLTDLTGRPLRQWQLDQPQSGAELSLQGLAKGLYLVEVQQGGRRAVKKLLVQ